MIGYRLARTLYRGIDRYLVRALPSGMGQRVRTVVLRMARLVFGAHIRARTVGEFTAGLNASNAPPAHLPDWAVCEIGMLVQFEPALAALAAPEAQVEAYTIPWDKTYLGDRYASARRQLGHGYAAMVLAGSGTQDDVAACLTWSARPLAVIDVDAEPTLRELAQGAGADYLALPAGDLDVNDHAALLVRLILQLHPTEVRYAQHPFLDVCRERHGLAMASVTRLAPLSTVSRSD